jgi:hypothetical protein
MTYDPEKFGQQLFAGLGAMNLRMIKPHRPLTEKETTQLKKCEQEAGNILPLMEHFREQSPFK